MAQLAELPLPLLEVVVLLLSLEELLQPAATRRLAVTAAPTATALLTRKIPSQARPLAGDKTRIVG